MRNVVFVNGVLQSCGSMFSGGLCDSCFVRLRETESRDNTNAVILVSTDAGGNVGLASRTLLVGMARRQVSVEQNIWQNI